MHATSGTTLGLSCLLGLGLAAGTWLMLDLAIFSRSRRLGDRVATQLGGTGTGPRAPGKRAPVPWWPMGTERARRLQTKLTAAGRVPDPLRHRSTTVLLCTLTGLVTASVFTLAAAQGTLQPLPAVIVLVCAVAGTAAYRQASLTRAVTRRRRRMTAQFPLLAELLALGVAAGESVGPALTRAAEEVGGELGDTVRSALARSAAGVPLSTCLRDLAAQARVPPLHECVDAIVVAGERGTPLATVLRDQAADAREASRRDLLEAGGKAELTMMAPVVFGLLPVSVLFAVFPSLDLLSLSL